MEVNFKLNFTMQRLRKDVTDVAFICLNTINLYAMFVGMSFLFRINYQVKRSIMLKMADACQRAGGQQTRFHEMHVQRHNNVSTSIVKIC